MGGQFSTLFGKKKEDEIDAKLRNYNEQMDTNDTINDDEVDKKKVKWWERLIFDKRMRIAYVFMLGVILGIIIPVIIFATKLEKKGKPIYGSCLIKPNARFQCLINSEEPETEEKCTRALCCWENLDDLEFKCFHSFPSAYQYNISTSEQRSENVAKYSDDIATAATTWTKLEMRTSHPELMSPITTLIHWESDEHLVVELFNSVAFPDRKSPITTKKNLPLQNEDENLPFSVSWGADESFFFIRIARRETNETIFDTRLGPVYATGSDISVATVLPTEYFYGLKGGQGSVSTLTYGIVNGFENSEFPFYISFEASGNWHGVLIDTTVPVLVQVVQAPGIMLQLEMDRPEINLHFFAGPTQPKILEQLHTFIREKHRISHPPMIPPYWGLGLHLCRKVGNSSVALQHVEELLKVGKSLVYDSDCIDEDLRYPIYINETQFLPNLTDILEVLQLNSKKILLSQKSTVLQPSELEESGSTISKHDQNYFKNLLVLDTRNASNITPFVGQVGPNDIVNYIDYFNSIIEFPPLPYMSNASNAEPLPYDGFSLNDNFPKLDFSSEYCPSPGTHLQSFFTKSLQTTSDNYVNVSMLWGSLCPLAASHNLTDTSQEDSGIQYKQHFELHNVYGEHSLKIVHRTMLNRHNATDKMLLTSSSFWTTSLYYGAYNGMQVPFTWKGLQESVENTVRNYALAPIAGTPICGGMLLNNVTFAKNNELCLRWFQFGLLMPLARNSYDGTSSYGPNQLSDQFRVYLNDTIKARYTYAPYYHTELLKYQKTYVPLIRPMSFDFNGPQDRNWTLPLLTQFMVGDAIFAAPIIDRGVTRPVYFPAGVWYTMDGQEAWTITSKGDSKQITGYITETPMFLRGGYMIPTLQNPQGLSIMETLQGNYTLLAALTTSREQIRTAKGSLLVAEPNSGSIHIVEFQTTMNYRNENAFMMIIKLNSTCASQRSNSNTFSKAPVSTIIDQVRIYGLPFLGALEVTVTSSTGVVHSAEFRYFGEHSSLRIYSLNIDWCNASEYDITVTKTSFHDY